MRSDVPVTGASAFTDKHGRPTLSVNRSPIVKAVVFLGLSALAVIGYLFLLNVLNGKVRPFSTAINLSLAAAVLFFARTSER